MSLGILSELFIKQTIQIYQTLLSQKPMSSATVLNDTSWVYFPNIKTTIKTSAFVSLTDSSVLHNMESLHDQILSTKLISAFTVHPNNKSSEVKMHFCFSYFYMKNVASEKNNIFFF